jgi:hypothetical protein
LQWLRRLRVEYKKGHSMSFRGNQEINDYTDLAALLQHSVPTITIHIRIVASTVVPTIGVAAIGVAAIRVAAIVSAIAAIVAAPAAVSASIAIAE